jgi:HSP20 family protein
METVLSTVARELLEGVSTMLPMVRNMNAFAPLFGSPVRMGDWFESVFGNDGAFLTHAGGALPVAVWQDDENVYVEAELPGVAEDDLEVTVHNGTLFLRGERKPVEGRQYLYNGRTYGRFERILTLPESVNADAVKAALANGVLSLTLPKSPEAKPRRITLNAS